MKKHFGNAELNILTRHYNETLETKQEKTENRKHLYDKLQISCDKIVFSDDSGSGGRIHHRYIRILTDKEERWFTFNDTILGRFNRGKDGWIVSNPSQTENLDQYLSKFESKTGATMMSANIIEIVNNSENSNRANEQLQNIWVFNNDACNIVSKIGEFSFTCPTNPISKKYLH